MKKSILLCTVFVLAGISASVQAQNNSAAAKSEVEYDVIYDDPYDLNKMWLHLFPLYADGFSTNFNVGFGVQANYLHKNKMDFRLHYRRAYGSVTDFTRAIGDKEKSTTNKLKPFGFLEGGATYHLVDRSDAGQSKMVIYTKRYSADKWAATVPEHILVPTKVRKIIGIRAGGYYWASAVGLNEVLTKQDVSLLNPTGDTLSTDNRIYSNLQSAGFYLGGSMGRIRNVAIKPKKYDANINDVLFTAYADLMYAPLLKVEDIRFDGESYAASTVKLANFGFRAGFEGMFNRDYSWSYGGELGYRPSVQGRSFYAVFKVGLVLATRFDQRRQSYQIEKPTETE